MQKEGNFSVLVNDKYRCTRHIRTFLAAAWWESIKKDETHECFLNVTSPAVITNYNAISRGRVCVSRENPDCVRVCVVRFVRQR